MLHNFFSIVFQGDFLYAVDVFGITFHEDSSVWDLAWYLNSYLG